MVSLLSTGTVVGCYVSMARSARLERVLNNGYVFCSVPGVEANWYTVDG
jgi:hypothetical protein